MPVCRLTIGDLPNSSDAELTRSAGGVGADSNGPVRTRPRDSTDSDDDATTFLAVLVAVQGGPPQQQVVAAGDGEQTTTFDSDVTSDLASATLPRSTGVIPQKHSSRTDGVPLLSPGDRVDLPQVPQESELTSDIANAQGNDNASTNPTNRLEDPDGTVESPHERESSGGVATSTAIAPAVASLSDLTYSDSETKFAESDTHQNSALDESDVNPAQFVAPDSKGRSTTAASESLHPESALHTVRLLDERSTHAATTDRAGSIHVSSPETPDVGSGATIPALGPAAPHAPVAHAPEEVAASDATGPSLGHQLTHAILAHRSELSRTGEAHLEVLLDPPELGRVWMRLSQTAEGIVARISAQNPATQSVLQVHLDAIRQGLAQSGLSMSDFQLAQHDAGHSTSDFDQSFTDPVAMHWRRSPASRTSSIEPGTLLRSGVDVLV